MMLSLVGHHYPVRKNLHKVALEGRPQHGPEQGARLPVTSRDKRLVGIVSFGDLALYADSKQTDTAITAVSERLPWIGRLS